jgi:16S rRNA (adenine1518-N6/adenine1519-N6)-dimethyltransferase
MRAKKSLGQHFLHSPAIARRIAEAACLDLQPVVFEIGPGRGILTAELLRISARVVAVEKDPDMLSVLTERFADEIKAGTLQLVEGDALVFTPASMGMLPGGYVLCANIPYYITGEILREYIGGSTPPTRAVLLVQKEVAERIVAKNNKESLLSLGVKVFGTPKYIQTVRAGSFVPAPAVDSAIIAIDIDPQAHMQDTDFLFYVAKIAFGKKRKQVGPTLSAQFSKERVDEALTRAGVAFTTRPEDIHVPQWRVIATHLATGI